jgi:hypothetical protein
MTMLGKRSRNWSLSDGEKMAAVDDSDRREERSRLRLGSSSSASTSGRAMASPVIITELAFSASTRRHTSWGSNWLMSTTLFPTKLWPMTAHWVAPCISGAMGRKVIANPFFRPRATRSSGACARSPDRTSMPPPRANSTSAWRHSTPLGRPVVPPV